MLILSPPCFVSSLQLLATPAHVPLLASLSASGCLLSPGACVASSSSRMSAHCGAVSTGWAGNTVLSVSICPRWLNVCAGQCGMLLCSGDALGCLCLFEQTSFLPSIPLLTHRQTLLFCVWQQSTMAGPGLVFIGPHTGSQSVSQIVWTPSGCCGPHPVRGKSPWKGDVPPVHTWQRDMGGRWAVLCVHIRAPCFVVTIKVSIHRALHNQRLFYPRDGTSPLC